MMYLTLQAGDYGISGQDHDLTLGPFTAFDVDYGSLTTYDADLDVNLLIALPLDLMPSGGGPRSVQVYEVNARDFPQLAPYTGWRFVRAIVHDGHAPCATEAVPLYERSSL